MSFQVGQRVELCLEPFSFVNGTVTWMRSPGQSSRVRVDCDDRQTREAWTADLRPLEESK